MSRRKQLNNGRYGAILFDLDGTLVDTAPDMVAVLQELQRDEGIDPVAYDLGRANVSNGALGLIRLAFPEATDQYRNRMHQAYLERYAGRLCIDSAVFPGLEQLLDQLDTARCPWGVVTNKPAHLTEPLLQALHLDQRAVCAVSGDTLAQRKPDPAPLLFACTMANVPADRTVYVGDAARDIQAGRAAGMATIAAGYGYITADDDPVAWEADLIASDTEELACMLRIAVNVSV